MITADEFERTVAPVPERHAVPRPPGVLPGEQPSWAALPEASRRGISLHRVLERLGATLGQEPMDPTEPVPPGQAAAVLVPLFEERGEARVVLTVRSDQLRSHRGQVAFPGGRLDSDESIVDGALREADEEAGIDPASVTVVGLLSSTPTVSTDLVMTPVVGTLAGRPEVRANPGEVERVFDVALSELVAPGIFHEELWLIGDGGGDGPVPVWFFEVAGETVWGATARVLVELLCLVLGVEPHRPGLTRNGADRA